MALRRGEQEINDLVARRRMRWLAFVGFSGLCGIAVFVLAVMLWKLFSRDTVAVLSKAPDWHFVVLLTVAIIVIAGVALSLSVAVLKMVTSSHSKSEKVSEDQLGISVTTPQLEFLKVLIETVKSLNMR